MDWKMMARAQGLELPEREMGRVAGPLTKLEEAFRPLAATLTPEMEPDTALRLGEDGE
jgi:hypothetical protein